MNVSGSKYQRGGDRQLFVTGCFDTKLSCHVSYGAGVPFAMIGVKVRVSLQDSAQAYVMFDVLLACAWSRAIDYGKVCREFAALFRSSLHNHGLVA